jgi:hypothetical protein
MNEESSVRREGFRKNARGTQLGLFDDKPVDDRKKASSDVDQSETLDTTEASEDDKQQ